MQLKLQPELSFVLRQNILEHEQALVIESSPVLGYKTNFSVLWSFDHSTNGQMAILRINCHSQNISVFKLCFLVVECATENDNISVVGPCDRTTVI